MKQLLFLSVLLFMACKGGQSNSNDTIQNVPFEEVVSGSQSKIETPQRKIIANQNELESLFKKINSTRSPEISIPKVDFEKHQLAFINMGQTSTGGYTVSVERIEKTDSNVVVHIGGTSPNPGDNVTMALTTPFTLVQFAKQELPIVFEPKVER
ncbi:protease complex subunit PrcB family protein [Marixanthomonas spongiae]|uniref:PrcB C-terminal domain-containing protein n=1 Tax=Marixanthomonas spongiae TaxID=2174845 RepID=A0A2U0I3G4_9FLAO|nr:protease complex subunit PrcB family protein [Marixanthomonas spongiae]PVW15643.1 hypothetical protein DDV96_05065 [Marixanthomonas spongiae]